MVRPSDDALKLLSRRYQNEPTRDLASEYGVAVSTIRHWFSDVGVQKSPPIIESSMPRYDKPPKMSPDCLVMSDSHVPYHDARFINNCISLAESWGITNLCLAGDTMDVSALSPFSNRPEATLRKELSDAQKFLLGLSSTFSDILLLPGNHERRLLHFLNEQLGMEHFLSLVGVSSNIRTSSYSFAIIGNKWIVGHPRNASVVAGRVPVVISRKYPGMSLATGHGHMAGLVVAEDGERMMVDLGMTADPKRLDWVAENLTARPSMAQGAVILKKIPSGIIWPYYLFPKMDWAAMSSLYHSDN